MTASRHRCTNCGLSFDAEEARCPQCLRTSSVVPAATGGERARRDLPSVWTAGIVLALLLTITTALGGFGTWDLSERIAARSWLPAVARVTGFRPRRLRCEVKYQFVVGNERVEGTADFFACPRDGETVGVRYDPALPSRQRAESALDLFLDVFGIAVGLAGLVLFGSVLLYLIFPDVPALQRFAAKLGSRHARER